MARRPLYVADHGLGEHLMANGGDGGGRTSLFNVFDALITKSRVNALAAGGRKALPAPEDCGRTRRRCDRQSRAKLSD